MGMPVVLVTVLFMTGLALFRFREAHRWIRRALDG
jgi:hypothetical protein